MENDASGVLWRRLGYFMSPQLDLYQNLRPFVDEKTVLEIGFGTGFGTVQYAHMAKRVMALEIDQMAVDYADKYLPCKAWFRKQDLIENPILPTRDRHGTPMFPNKWDVILCIETLEHVGDPDKMMSAMARHVHEDGTVIISGPNANGTFRKNDIHEREWTAKEFLDNLHRYFKSVKLYDYTLKERQNSSTKQTPLVAVCRLPML